MAEVKLYKRTGTYLDQKDGTEKPFTNFFVACGDVFVPVEVKYFEDKETGRDDRYRERKVLLSAFAEVLPERKNAVQKDKAAGSKSTSAVDEDGIFKTTSNNFLIEKRTENPSFFYFCFMSTMFARYNSRRFAVCCAMSSKLSILS